MMRETRVEVATLAHIQRAAIWPREQKYPRLFGNAATAVLSPGARVRRKEAIQQRAQLAQQRAARPQGRPAL